MPKCPQCGDPEARPGGHCPICGLEIPEEPEQGFDDLERIPDTGTFEIPAPRTPPPLPKREPEPEPSPVRPSRRRRSGRARRRPAPAPVAYEDIPVAVPIGAPIDAIEAHAELHLTARYEFTSVPGDDPPITGILLEIEATGAPLIAAEEGPVAHVILALDVSASMRSREKYPVLRDAVRSMLDDLHASSATEVLLSVVIFSRGSETILRGVPARQVTATELFDRMEKSDLMFRRYTDIPGALGRAGRIAYDQTRTDKTLPVRLYLLTDGRPQDETNARAAADRVGKVAADIHALAFGADADVVILQSLFAGKRGGTVKSVRHDTIGSAFERVAEVAQRVVATRSVVELELAPGVVGGNAFRYRPGRVRYPDPAFADGKRFTADLGTIETGRKYSLLFEIRPPETEGSVTQLGEARVSIPGHGGPISTSLPLSIARTSAGSLPGDEDAAVRTARDILGALSDEDPEVALRALRLRRELYARERRDPALIGILDQAIHLLETKGSLDGLSPDDYATLLAHTCTSGSESDSPFALR